MVAATIHSLGAWGTAIFSDDTASDVRDEWREAILDGLSPEDATQRLLETFDDYLEEADTERLFWMALAAAQMETGRLLPDVCDRALAIIDGGGDVDRWREDGDESLARQRARVLERLAAKLRGPQPKPKRLRRPVALSVPLEVGDVVCVQAQRQRPTTSRITWVGASWPRQRNRRGSWPGTGQRITIETRAWIEPSASAKRRAECWSDDTPERCPSPWFSGRHARVPVSR